MAALPIQLDMPCIRTELLLVAATAVEQWVATDFTREFLFGDVIWDSSESGPAYITPCLTEVSTLHYGRLSD